MTGDLRVDDIQPVLCVDDLFAVIALLLTV
jgi:hypothetical protein